MCSNRKCWDKVTVVTAVLLGLFPTLTINDIPNGASNEQIHPFTLTTLYNFIKNGLTDFDRKNDAASAADWLLLLLDDPNMQHLADVQFTFPNSDAKCYGHRLILSGRSPIFRKIFSDMQTSTAQILIDDMEVSIFPAVLRFIYAKIMPSQADSQQIFGMLYAGQKYVVPSLVEASMEMLKNMLNAENAVYILEQSTRMDLKDLMGKSWEMIRSQAVHIINSPDFEKVTVGFLKNFMQQDELKGLSESLLFDRVLAWAKEKLGQLPPSEMLAVNVPERSLVGGGSAVNQRLRAVLAPVLFEFRFLSMDSEEFAKGPCMSGVLSKDEQLEILLSIGNGDGGKHWKSSFSRLKRSTK